MQNETHQKMEGLDLIGLMVEQHFQADEILYSLLLAVTTFFKCTAKLRPQDKAHAIKGVDKFCEEVKARLEQAPVNSEEPSNAK